MSLMVHTVYFKNQIYPKIEISNLPLIRGLKILGDATEQDVLMCAIL